MEEATLQTVAALSVADMVEITPVTATASNVGILEASTLQIAAVLNAECMGD